MDSHLTEDEVLMRQVLDEQVEKSKSNARGKSGCEIFYQR